MAKVLVLDISTSTGFSEQEHTGDVVVLRQSGTIVNEEKVDAFGAYPFGYLLAAKNVARMCMERVRAYDPEVVVIEETNGSKSRYTQKILEFLHFAVLDLLHGTKYRVVYVNTSDWRKAVGGVLSSEDKKKNVKVAAAKRKARRADGTLDLKLFSKLKKELGIRGKVNKKHVAIRVANELFNLELKPKDDDIADAICIGVAWARGVAACDGKK